MAQAWILVSLAMLGLDVTMFVVAAATLVAVVVEQVRRRVPGDGLWNRWVGQHVMRPREASQWLGATYLFLGSLLVLLAGVVLVRAHALTFSQATVAAAASLIMLIIGDALTALIGPSLGGPIARRNRRWSGALGFVVAGLLVYAILPVSLAVALALAVAAAAAEFLTPAGWDDNISIPLVCFLVLLLL